MENKDDRFLAALNAEKLNAQERRGELISKKLAWITGLFALGAIKLPLSIESRTLLFFVPVVSLVYDLYILGENYGIKRMGCFVRQHLASSHEGEWESWLRDHRDRFSWIALYLSTVIILLASGIVLLLAGENEVGVGAWAVSLIGGMFILYREAGNALKRLDRKKVPNKAPEPTPLPVTIPAEPGIAPGSGVAHL